MRTKKILDLWQERRVDAIKEAAKDAACEIVCEDVSCTPETELKLEEYKKAEANALRIFDTTYNEILCFIEAANDFDKELEILRDWGVVAKESFTLIDVVLNLDIEDYLP